ncbi:MAG: hypothetical protein P4M15_05065 [Alphaproteobacteria bacterium]|nr:hypothetical protein [Alphaproteobacteria bacterium]
MFIIHPPHFLPPKGHSARRLALAFLLIAPFAIGVLAVLLGQDINWDLRNYHFYNAYAFLNDRYGQDLLPSQTPSFYNPLMDVPFFWAATHAPARAAGFMMGFVQGFNIILLFMIAEATLIVPNPHHKVIVCAALATLGLLGGGGIAQIGTTFGDNLTSLGILLSAALVVRHLDRLSIDKGARVFALAFLFGVPAGLMMGLKLPAVIYCVGLCAGLLFAGGAWKRRVMLSFAFGLGVLVGMAITYGPWALFLQSHFGSPFFPYFNDIFKSPLAAPVGGRDIEYVARSWHDRLLLPFIFADSPFRVGEIPWRDWRIPILYVLLPLAIMLRLFFGRTRAPSDSLAAPYAARYLLASFAVAYAVWVGMFGIYRYAVTLEMITPLLIVFAVGMLPLKISTRALVAAFMLAVISASIQPGNWGRRPVWLDKFVEAQIPDLGDTSNLMIVMAGIEPYAHLVPEFPPQIDFVRLQSNFSNPGQNPGIDRIIQARIDAHRAAKGRFLLLVQPWLVAGSDPVLRAFGLALAGEPCQNVIDRLFEDKPMSLCPVIALKNK